MPSLNGITTQEEELRGCHVTTLDVQTGGCGGEPRESGRELYHHRHSRFV
ncbi:MAG: hypothetical protein ACLU9S_15570 [Oscillospiraceae bacterium]